MGVAFSKKNDIPIRYLRPQFMLAVQPITPLLNRACRSTFKTWTPRHLAYFTEYHFNVFIMAYFTEYHFYVWGVSSLEHAPTKQNHRLWD